MAPKKLDYQWSFSYLTGFTGSIGFSFLFLSFLKKLRKKNPATRERSNWVVHFLWSGIIPISGLTPEPPLAAFGGIGFLSFRPGRTKGQQNLSILFILSNILRKIN